MFGLNALWSPVLHYLEQTDEILLFYSEQEAVITGDVKLIRTRDEGMSWSEPETILTHEALGHPESHREQSVPWSQRRLSSASVLDQADR